MTAGDAPIGHQFSSAKPLDGALQRAARNYVLPSTRCAHQLDRSSRLVRFSGGQNTVTRP